MLCSPTLRNYFINYARPLIYSTVMSHLAVIAMRESTLFMHHKEADEVGWLQFLCRIICLNTDLPMCAGETKSTRIGTMYSNTPVNVFA